MLPDLLMKDILLILLLTLISCSHPQGELSKGEFNIQTAKAYHDIELTPNVEVDFDREIIPSGKPITGKLYFSNDQIFVKVSEELNLKYSKIFYYYPNGNIDNRVRIGEEADTLDFEIYSNVPLKSDTTTVEAFGIRARFSNLTDSYDTTFIRAVEINWN